MILRMQGIAHLRGNATLVNLVSSSQLECSCIEDVGIKHIVLVSFEFPRGHQPQTTILSKPLLPHQERLRRTFHSGRLMMPLLQFGPQWEQIVDLPSNYLLQFFLMVRLLSSVTPTARKKFCGIFQLALKTGIQFTTTNSFSRNC